MGFESQDAREGLTQGPLFYISLHQPGTLRRYRCILALGVGEPTEANETFLEEHV